jgi:hypothetical protein
MSALVTDGAPVLISDKGGIAATIKKDAQESANN